MPFLATPSSVTRAVTVVFSLPASAPSAPASMASRVMLFSSSSTPTPLAGIESERSNSLKVAVAISSPVPAVWVPVKVIVSSPLALVAPEVISAFSASWFVNAKVTPTPSTGEPSQSSTRAVIVAVSAALRSTAVASAPWSSSNTSRGASELTCTTTVSSTSTPLDSVAVAVMVAVPAVPSPVI